MRKKDYVFSMVNLILNRVRFHAPKTDEAIDYESVLQSGVDPSKPVLCFRHPMTKLMALCFKKAQEKQDFNLVLSSPNKYCKKLKYIETNCAEVEKLDINYKSGLIFGQTKQDDYIKINGRQIEGKYDNFFLDDYGKIDEINFFVRQYVLSGRNICVELTNSSLKPKTATLEINFVLPLGYYCFKKFCGGIEIFNLRTFEKQFFNFSSFKNSFSFSCVDGVENSTNARVFLKTQVDLKPKQKKRLFFNFGNQKFSVSTKEEIDYFALLAQKKNNEKFNLKICSNNKSEDELVNHILPQKIYKAWLKGERDEQSEKRYNQIKAKYVSSGKESVVFGNLEGIKSLQLFDGEVFRTIFVVSSSQKNENYLQIGSTKYFGKNSLKLNDLRQKIVQICVSEEKMA